jgi:CRP/FNR family cyclic AMP-dependent transcriptional regulator
MERLRFGQGRVVILGASPQSDTVRGVQTPTHSHLDPLAGAPRPLSDVPALAERAADLLRTPGALLNLTPPEAAALVAQMRLMHFGPGVTLFREGDGVWLDHLLLLLEGEVSIEIGVGGGLTPVAISVVGPGSVIGEMALLDGAPRSASCTTVSSVQAAALSRHGLEALIDQQPRVAVKLLIGLGSRIGERLRALGEQLQMYADVVERQQQQIDRLRSGGTGG